MDLMSDQVEDTQTGVPVSTSLLDPYKMHGWQPDPSLSVDENLLRAVLLVTRNSICIQGYMGCILINPSKFSGFDDSNAWKESIVGVCTNKPLYTNMDSDVHAEIGALGQAARLGNSTEGCTAYITMPPCKTCFGALYAAGIRRIVSPRRAIGVVSKAAPRVGIEMVSMTDDDSARTSFLNKLTGMGDGDVTKRSSEAQAEIEEKRKKRKEERAEKKRRKKERQKTAANNEAATSNEANS